MIRSPYIVVIALLAGGVGLFAAGSTHPQYRDPDWNAQLYGPQWGGHSDADADRWFATRSRLLTSRDDLHDDGLAVAGLGVGLAIVLAATGVRRWSDLAGLQSPGSHRRWATAAAVTWLSFVPSMWAFYTYTSERGDYPPMGDVVFIPEAGVTAFGLLGLPIVLFGVRLVTAEQPLPVRLWRRPAIRCSNVVSLAVYVALFAAIGVLVVGFVQVPTIVPSTVVTLYLLLAGRAATRSARKGGVVR